MSKKVTVVLPVFNAEKFLDKAIESVLIQEEVNELILVEDGSTDNSINVCKEYLNRYPDRIKFLSHRHNLNKGAAASRNLGILNSTNEFIGFLDADDFYLKDRFKNALDIFSLNTDADGVYESIGTHYYDNEGKELHEKRMNELNIQGLPVDQTSLTSIVAPEKLFETLIMGNKGWFHFNGLTLRKSAFLKAGILDEFLWYGQDIEFFLRLSIFAKLYPGNLKVPVAIRGVYSQNSTLSVYKNEDRLFMNQRCASYRWKKAFMIMLEKDFSIKINRFLLNRFIDYYDDDMMNMQIGGKRKLRKFYLIILVIYRYKDVYRKVI